MDLRPLTRYCVRQGNIRFARTTVLSKETIFEAAVYIAIGFVVFWTRRSCTDQNIHRWGDKIFHRRNEISKAFGRDTKFVWIMDIDHLESQIRNGHERCDAGKEMMEMVFLVIIIILIVIISHHHHHHHCHHHRHHCRHCHHLLLKTLH